MSRKKILIINPISLFPKVMASQDRVFNMVKRLSQDHIVDVVTPIRNKNELNESEKNLKDVCHRFYPIPAINPTNNLLKRKLYGLGYLFYHYFYKYPGNYYYNTRKYYLSRYSKIISDNKYDIVQVEYWYMAKIFKDNKDIKLKVIDSHDILFSKREQELKNRYGKNLSAAKKRYLSRYKVAEIDSLKLADLIIFITKSDQDSLSHLSLASGNIIIATGQNIDFFKNFQSESDTKTILFYGSMSSKPNIDAFFYLKNEILPLIKKEVPEIKLMVVGANPPDTIKKLHNRENIIVTGFVQDVRPYLAKANFFILPLNVAAGFRSRIVDVMAMGIPVIGTYRALDNIGMNNGIHGYITDSKEEMANLAIKLLRNPVLRQSLGEECRRFVSDNYSIEATYGKLSRFFLIYEETKETKIKKN